MAMTGELKKELLNFSLELRDTVKKSGLAWFGKTIISYPTLFKQNILKEIASRQRSNLGCHPQSLNSR
jgi:hypothetical protein